MNKCLGIFCSAAFAAALSVPAYAGFTNGGFEDGTFNGWTVQQGFNNYDNDASYYGVSAPSFQADPLANVIWGSAAANLAAPAPVPTIVNKTGYLDPFVPNIQSIFIGSDMAKINDIDGYYHVTQLSQTGVIDASDLSGGATSASLYINWVGVMDNPGHPPGDNPWFLITVNKNGSLLYQDEHFSDDPGWTQTGFYSGTGDPVFEDSGQVVLSGLLVGDQVNVSLTIADCAWGGHGAYAYLDGIGTSYVPPPPGVPDTASTLALLGLGLTALAGLRRRLS
jgi:VPDSG-CTERM motif